ncbi:IS3 family transposase [Flavobacterium sharifuzzamanii]|uniref:IS3 family transposase n=1 Tax=Flavobacterium sharifuzzamanii TaxID=2211133 RepID=UPI000DAF4272|nr:IS3 family transposase [Flavobacterium sharifuzzamanii]KAF2082007.1 IS3 family transposase [Flavobacterium sharifuzzamanii]
MEKHKIYDRDFKLNAVKLALKTNRFKVAKELGIATTNIYRWQAEFRKYGVESFANRNPERKRLAELKIALKRKLKKIELHIEIFKSASKYISEGKPSIFHFIENNLDKYSLWSMCEVLHIRTGTYHKWKNKIISPSKCRKAFLEEVITSIFYEYKGMYGNERIAVELQSRGIQLKKGQVSFYMKKLGLISKHSIRNKVKSSTRFIPNNPCIFPNVLDRQFKTYQPSCVWVSGITSLEVSEGLLFLTIIIDLFDEKIIGWNLSEGVTIKETSMPAWEMAVRNRKIKKGLLFHSNRSFQYANKIFTRKLNSYKDIKRSMSRAGNHLDNAVPRIFFTSLKSELADLNMLLTKKQMEEKISEYIKISIKIHDVINYKTSSNENI